MKKVFILLFIFPVLACFHLSAQDKHMNIVDGKVVFSKTYNPPKEKSEIRRQLLNYFEKSNLQYGDSVVIDDQDLGTIVSRKTDYLSIENTNWKIFGMYIRYYLVLEYSDKLCTARIQRIKFYEADEVNKIPDVKSVYPAEYILIDKKYNILSVKRASYKIETKTTSYIAKIFDDIEIYLNN